MPRPEGQAAPSRDGSFLGRGSGTVFDGGRSERLIYFDLTNGYNSHSHAHKLIYFPKIPQLVLNNTSLYYRTKKDLPNLYMPKHKERPGESREKRVT